MSRKKHDEDDDDTVDNWLAVRDQLSNLIQPAKGWEDADCIGEISDMAINFRNAYPDFYFTFEDIRLALFDLNVPLERNEHNSKYYYLANWK